MWMKFWALQTKSGIKSYHSSHGSVTTTWKTPVPWPGCTASVHNNHERVLLEAELNKDQIYEWLKCIMDVLNSWWTVSLVYGNNLNYRNEQRRTKNTYILTCYFTLYFLMWYEHYQLSISLTIYYVSRIITSFLNLLDSDISVIRNNY